MNVQGTLDFAGVVNPPPPQDLVPVVFLVCVVADTAGLVCWRHYQDPFAEFSPHLLQMLCAYLTPLMKDSELLYKRRTEVSPNANRPIMPNRPPVQPYLVNLSPDYPKSPQHAQNQDYVRATCSSWSLELVYEFVSRLDKKWMSYSEQKTICPYLSIRTKFWPINW